MRTVLQVPLSIDLRRSAERKALEQGFSSLQEAVRVFLKKLSEGAMGVVFNDKDSVQLSAKNVRRYDKMIEDIESGRVKTEKFSDVASLMRSLNK